MSKKMRASIEESAVAAGLAHRVQMWQAWSTDEEGDERFSLHDTLDEAELESVDRPPSPISQIQVAPEVALMWCGDKSVSPFQSLAALTSLAFGDSDVDGIWWHDLFLPWDYSAPRGGIFQGKIPGVSQAVIPAHDSMEDEEVFDVIRRGRIKVASSRLSCAGLREGLQNLQNNAMPSARVPPTGGTAHARIF